ncbi:hypothetical protein [Turneriella parva]|uniref:hypothetical protein n=1 Tax=Turneriella parva TaxID=29510 RepID=UPI0002D42374|nr:hypothetical protein [Turneriella parva]
MLSTRWKVIHGLGLCLFFVQLAGAFEVASMQRPKFYLCVHTKQKIEKGKPCPCGCDKRMKALAKVRLLSADHACANESDDAVVPAYSRWLFTNEAPSLVARGMTSTSYFTPITFLSSINSELETPPPRIG